MNGVIAAGDKQTAEAGARILGEGGNAVDAAVAAAFVSFISEIGMVHLGGSGMGHIFDPRTHTSVVYDFFSNMPGLGIELDKSKLDFSRVTVDFGGTTQDFHIGRGSVAVPGNILGLCQMAADHGRLPLAQLLAPAIELARAGHALPEYQAHTCQILAPLYTHTEGMRQIFAKADNGRIIQAGERLYIPHLAETLEALAEHGPAYARTGALAEALVADQATHGGLVTAADLAAYEVATHEPIRLPYRDYEILLPRPSSTGGVLTAFTLKLLSSFDVGQWAHGSADHLQLLAEAMSATTRARRHWELALLAMPVKEAVRGFLDEEFVGNFAAEAALALWKGRPSQSFDEGHKKPNTSHLSVIDGEGMAVSLTTTAGESAGYVVPGTGYIPNNMLGEDDLHPHGFHASPAGPRIHTMMCPVVVLKDGRIKLVVGSGGSIRIRSAILQVMSNFLDFNMPLDEAVAAPRVHLEKQIMQCEGGYDPQAVDELEGLGYQVNRWQGRSLYFGGAHSVAVQEDGQLTAVGDSRRGGAIAVSP